MGIQRSKIRKADLAGESDQLLLDVDEAVGIAGAPVEGVFEFADPWQAEPHDAPGLDTVRRIPRKRSRELRTVKRLVESGIQNRIRTGLGACIRTKQWVAPLESVTERKCERVILVLAPVLQAEQPLLGRPPGLTTGP